MSREYTGDISGSFWAAIQPYNAADRFGVAVEQPARLNYAFYKSNLPEIDEELSKITETLGDNLEKLEKFFQKNDCYNGADIAEELGIPESEAWKMIREYADYKLGMEIKRCVERKSYCYFTADLE